MKTFPSTSRTEEPFALSMKSGVPPTDRNARTGEFTPPGMSPFAIVNSLPEVVVFSLPKGVRLLPGVTVLSEKIPNDTSAGGHCQFNVWYFHGFYEISKRHYIIA